jgi:ubiquinone/menaquinone biosynthesis C-methylase UbiE
MDVEQYYDEKAPYYDGEYKIPFYRLYNTITWENIKKVLPEEGLILDAGGGTGEWAIRLAESGYNVVLTDISRGMLRQARLKLEEKTIQDVTLQRADIQDMSCFSDETFDMAIAQGDPLSYCSDAERAVNELYRVLRPGCYCIASVDSLHHFTSKLIRMARWDILETVLQTRKASFQKGFTIRYYTPESLCTLFEDVGFTVVRIVGKPVLLSVIPHETANLLLKDDKTFERIVKLELEYCDDPALIGFAGHLEIVGKKEGTHNR